MKMLRRHEPFSMRMFRMLRLAAAGAGLARLAVRQRTLHPEPPQRRRLRDALQRR